MLEGSFIVARSIYQPRFERSPSPRPTGRGGQLRLADALLRFEHRGFLRAWLLRGLPSSIFHSQFSHRSPVIPPPLEQPPDIMFNAISRPIPVFRQSADVFAHACLSVGNSSAGWKLKHCWNKAGLFNQAPSAKPFWRVDPASQELAKWHCEANICDCARMVHIDSASGDQSRCRNQQLPPP